DRPPILATTVASRRGAPSARWTSTSAPDRRWANGSTSRAVRTSPENARVAITQAADAGSGTSRGQPSGAAAGRAAAAVDAPGALAGGAAVATRGAGTTTT